jgi:nucleoside-diphosphate-sugar epimerase
MGGLDPGRPLPADDLEYVLEESGDVWEQLRGRKLLITGATGFFGRWLLESLLVADARHSLNASVVALSRDPAAFIAKNPHLAGRNIRWAIGSVTTLTQATLEGRELDFVVHLATEADMAASAISPAAAANVITGGTGRVLDVATGLGARRLLFTSSGAAYGPQPPGVEAMPESYAGVPDPSHAANPYAAPGEAKRQAELLCEKYSRERGLESVIARCFTFAGPAIPLDSKFAFGNFLGDALAGRTIVVKGDGTPIRSYLYAADLAVWLWTLLLRGVAGRRYNVGSEQPTSIRNLAETIALTTGGVQVEIQGHAAARSAPERYVPSTARARQELGLREHFSLPEVVRRTAAWHRSGGKH